MENHLIITTATLSEDDNSPRYSEEIRINDYIESFNSILPFKDLFKSITLIETISKEKVIYLEKSGFNIYYSDFDNHFDNKGRNEINHIYNFLVNNNIDDNDYVIKLSGRYKIKNDNLIKNLKHDFIAKNDADIYQRGKGVHTFFYAFKKFKFLEFFDWYNKNSIEVKTGRITPIEWDVKIFIEINKNCKMLNKNEIIGVETCLHSKTTNRWLRMLV